jgi:hypothetical protein
MKTMEAPLRIFFVFTISLVNSVGAKKFTFITSSKLSLVANENGATLVNPAQLTNPSITGSSL